MNKEGLKIALLFLIIILGTSCNPTAKDIVFTVNGEPIGLDEYEHQLDQDKLKVISYFQNKYHTPYGPDFWTLNFNGEIPLDTLKQRAKETIIVTSIKKSIAREMGLIRRTSYKDFLKELDSVNKERLQAVKMGKVIYGPVTYQQEVYSGYYLSILENAIKEKMTLQGVPKDQVIYRYSALVQKNIKNAKIKIHENVYQQIEIH